jgi:hypothetical protein
MRCIRTLSEEPACEQKCPALFDHSAGAFFQSDTSQRRLLCGNRRFRRFASACAESADSGAHQSDHGTDARETAAGGAGTGWNCAPTLSMPMT